MRVAFLAASIAATLACASAITLLACSDEGNAVADRDGSPPDPGSSGGSVPGPDDDEKEDAGKKFAPSGCELRTTEHKIAGKAENLPRTGGIDWVNVANALTDDGAFAEITLDDGQESAELEVSDFGITLPPNAETWGIVVELKRRTLTDGGRVQTGQVNVQIARKTSNFKFDKDTFVWPTSIIGRHGYGQEVDTWNVDLVPGDVTASTFAAKIWARKVPDAGVPGPVKAGIDSLKVAVWYCLL